VWPRLPFEVVTKAVLACVLSCEAEMTGHTSDTLMTQALTYASIGGHVAVIKTLIAQEGRGECDQLDRRHCANACLRWGAHGGDRGLD
jgi:hypothetical protein